MRVLNRIINLEPDLDEQLAMLQKLDLRFFEVGADQARVIYHRIRGEEELAAEIESRVELQFVQLGSAWQIEAFMPAISALLYGFTRDMIGLRRTIEELAAKRSEGFRFEGFLAVARGDYLRERGDVEAALAELEPVAAWHDFPMIQSHALPAYAETLVAVGQAERAKQVAEQGLALSLAEATRNRHTEVRSLRALALAETALGDTTAAARRVDAALAESTPRGSPLLTGSLHETRARVALAAGDQATYREHLEACDRQFRATRNPVLIARAERLAMASRDDASVMRRLRERMDTVGTERSVVADAVTTPSPADARAFVTGALSACRGPAERAAKALQLVLANARGVTGYLFLRRAGVLQLVAPAAGDEPPTAMRADVERAIAPVASDASTVVERRPVGRAWMTVPLVQEAGGLQTPIGAVAVLAGALAPTPPDPRLLAEIARELVESGDVTYARARSEAAE